MSSSTMHSPRPLPYHRALVEHLRSAEPGLWRWFASTQKREQEVDAVRLDLLKSTYRLEPQAQPKVHELAEQARHRLGLGCRVTLYQAQTGNVLNAALAYLPGEAHVILSGPLAEVLSEGELQAVLAHELAHFLLYEEDGGSYLVATDLLRALSADTVAGPAASESARLFTLWTEIFADRWAYQIGGDVSAAVAALIKVQTGLSAVSAESYLRQADEIFARSTAATENLSHPESYIRARALRLWSEQGDGSETEIGRMIEGGLSVHRLDLLGQVRAASLTRRFLQLLLRPAWFRTEAVLAHARQFFADFADGAVADEDAPLRTELEGADESLRDYFCYLMLDFATVDRELGDVSLSAAIVLAHKLGIDKRLAELAQKELALGKKAYAKIDKEAQDTLATAEVVNGS